MRSCMNAYFSVRLLLPRCNVIFLGWHFKFVTILYDVRIRDGLLSRQGIYLIIVFFLFVNFLIRIEWNVFRCKLVPFLLFFHYISIYLRRLDIFRSDARKKEQGVQILSNVDLRPNSDWSLTLTTPDVEIVHLFYISFLFSWDRLAVSVLKECIDASDNFEHDCKVVQHTHHVDKFKREQPAYGTRL